MIKLNCSILITCIITALAVFLGNLGHSEYQSQMKKRKDRKPQVEQIEEAAIDTAITMSK